MKNMNHNKIMPKDGLELDVRDKIIHLCKAIIPDASIFLYGSRSRGDYAESSDIDLALKANRPISYFEISELKDVLSASNISYTISIIDFASITDEKFKKNIEKEMVLWQK